jgi:hypothetical protein
VARHRVGLPNITPCILGWLVLDVGACGPTRSGTGPAWLPIPASDLERLSALLRGHDGTVWRASADLIRQRNGSS